MQYQFFLGTFLALAAGTSAMPSPQLSPAAQCWSTCSTDCVFTGSLNGGLCSDDGTCTCIVGGIKERSPAPAPQSAATECWETCSTGCEGAGNLRGGLCSSNGTCTCLTGTGIMARKAAPEPQAA
ncbi:hypothetical protein LOCC1_G008422, partial [Lachnellula occidentalis]